jgi:hypothetical protein
MLPQLWQEKIFIAGRKYLAANNDFISAPFQDFLASSTSDRNNH